MSNGTTADPVGVHAFGDKMMRGHTPEPIKMATDISKEAVESKLRALFMSPKGVEEFVDVQELAYAQSARIAELEAYSQKVTAALTSRLTAGGSEFFAGKIGDMYLADVEYCVQHINDRADSREQLGRAKASAALKSRIAELEAALRSIADAQPHHTGQTPNEYHFQRRAREALIPTNPTPQPKAPVMFGLDGVDNDE